MKNHLFRASSILAVLSLLVALGVSGTAQQPTQPQPREQEQQRLERPIPGLVLQELSPEALQVAVPQACMGIKPVVQIHDVADNFSPPGNPVSLSQALTNFLNANNWPRKGYDDKRTNMFFADSFSLKNCRVCYATLETRVRHYQDVWTNDNITIGAAPFNSSPGIALIYTGLWNPPVPNPKTLTYVLPTTALNSYLFNTPTMPTYLDVIAQDDTDFDYAKLSVWYY
jgi:hypothetical protein